MYQKDNPRFVPFKPDGEVRTYVRNLPHWRQAGATYFVTFRMADSIPAAILVRWQRDRESFYRSHGIEPSTRHSAPKHFATAYARISPRVRSAFERDAARRLHEELDMGHGSCALRHREPQKIVMDALKYFDGKRMWLGDVVIMPNHVHTLVQPCDGWELEDLLASIKKWTARCLGSWMGEKPLLARGKKFWQAEGYDRIVRDREELAAYRKYILENPEKSKLAAGEYAYYCAEWLPA